MQDDGAFSDGDCNNDKGSLNMQFMDNHNDFDDNSDDSQEDKKAICEFSKDTLDQIVNKVTPQKEIEIEQINKEIHTRDMGKKDKNNDENQICDGLPLTNATAGSENGYCNDIGNAID
eukprot:10936366-Ditylum_brightwellii.AAC.2